MVSNFGYIPIFESSKIIKTNDLSKDKLTTAIQHAVTQVQNAVTSRNIDDPLRTDLPEVWHLCDCLDKAFLYGLRELEVGYWPFVKEFTHHDVQLQIQTLSYVQSSLGRSRAWLCLALNEASVESYVNSFIQNSRLVEKHYLQPALLRDVQRMQLVLTLMAGLENIKFELLVDSSYLDAQGFVYMGGTVERDSDIDTLSLGSCGLDSTTVTPVSTKSIVDDDSGVLSIDIENAAEASSETVQKENVERKCSCHDCSAHDSPQLGQRERASHLISLNPVTILDQVGDSSIEVIHTKILKRRKKTSIAVLETSEYESSELNSASDCDENNEVPFSSDSFRQPAADFSCSMTDLLGERGVPEGQEDPPDPVCIIDSEKIAAQMSEELSIYDDIAVEESSVKHDLPSDTVSQCHKQPSLPTPSECSPYSSMMYEEEVAQGRLENAAEDLSLKVDMNAKLYLMLEVFLKDGEEFYKMFLTSMQRSHGPFKDVFLLLSNCCVYILYPGDESEKFRREAHIFYEKLDCITVDLNYQGFQLFQHKNESPYHICTGSEQLTRNILSSLEVMIRRSGSNCLPSVTTDASAFIARLRKKVQNELSLKEDSVMLYHFVLVSWENYMGASPPSTPAGPVKEGFLMYRVKSREKMKWNPGYFLLKGGFLYCFSDSSSKDPLFYFQLSAQRFRGCYREHNTERPYAFELLLHGGNESLTLAAANEDEVSLWLQEIVQTFTLVDQIRDLEQSRLIAPCYLLMANNYMFTLLEESKGSQILGTASVNDLVAVRMDQEFPTCCVLEFESGEANSCSGEWILLFVDEEEREKFVALVTNIWEKLFEVPLTVADIKDLSLWGRCRERFQNREQTKESLKSLCFDR